MDAGAHILTMIDAVITKPGEVSQLWSVSAS